MPLTLTRRSLDLAGLDVPALEFTGTSDGPLLTVLAGVHGCEYAPMAALRAWAGRLAARELRGRVVAVPVLNLPAFRARSPFVVPDDGKNLNRCFPGDPSGSLAERLAYDTFTKVIKGSDALIDMHAGDMVEALQPFALYDAGQAQARAADLASAYGLGYVIRQEPGPERAVGGTTSAAAAEIGIPAIIAEAGGCGLVTQAAVDAHVRGLNRVLALLGMAEDPDRRLDAAAARPAAAVPLAALPARGMVGARGTGGRLGCQGPGAGHRQQHRRHPDAGDHRRAWRRRSHVRDEFAGCGSERAAPRPRRQVTRAVTVRTGPATRRGPRTWQVTPTSHYRPS